MEIRIYPNTILRKKCLAVKEVGRQEQKIFEEMVKLMRQAGGMGLAACQVGLDKQMLVVDLGNKALKLANPKICKREASQSMEEGCLSLPEITVEVKRAEKIKLEAVNELNQLVSFNAEGILAIALQHEIDHLQGKLIIDYLPWYKKLKAIRKLKSKRQTKTAPLWGPIKCKAFL